MKAFKWNATQTEESIFQCIMWLRKKDKGGDKWGKS